MEVILLSDVDHVGLRGDVVSVARGYARNFLLPRSSPRRRRRRASRSCRSATRSARATRRRRPTRRRRSPTTLEQTVLRFEVKAGPTGSLFGSVTPTDIADELWSTKKIRVDRRKIETDPIKRIGRYAIPIDIFQDVRVEVKTEVIPEGGELPSDEELAAMEAAERAEQEAAAAEESHELEEILAEVDAAEAAEAEAEPRPRRPRAESREPRPRPRRSPSGGPTPTPRSPRSKYPQREPRAAVVPKRVLSLEACALAAATLALTGASAAAQDLTVHKVSGWRAPGVQVTVTGWDEADGAVVLRERGHVVDTTTAGPRGKYQLGFASFRPGCSVDRHRRRRDAERRRGRIRPVTLAAVGDITFGEQVGPTLDRLGGRYPWTSVAPSYGAQTWRPGTSRPRSRLRGTPAGAKQYTFRGAP